MNFDVFEKVDFEKVKFEEVDFEKVKLPSTVERFLDKFVQSMKGANLNRIKRSAILYKVINASGMNIQQLMADIQKIKYNIVKIMAQPMLSNNIVIKYSPCMAVDINFFFCRKKATIKPIKKVPLKP